MARFTSPPAVLLDRVSFYLKLTMQKNMKEYTSNTLIHLIFSCSNGYRTFCCWNNSVSVYFQFWRQWRAAYKIDMMAVFFLSVNTCSY